MFPLIKTTISVDGTEIVWSCFQQVSHSPLSLLFISVTHKIKTYVYGFSQRCMMCKDSPWALSQTPHLTLWPINAKNTASRDCAADEPYPLPFCRVSQRKWIFHIPSMQPQLKMHLFLWRVWTICVTKALTAQSIPLTQDLFFTMRWDNSQTASELTNVTA